MAGIGFELRKLFREQGLINNAKALAYSSVTTVGPMIICILLILGLQRLLINNLSYLEKELYIATVSYCFIFSIVLTSGVTIVLTRYVADQMFAKSYERLLSSFYGALSIMLPVCSAAAIWFLSGAAASLAYKAAAYIFFILLVIIWIQGVYLSALKDYVRIARGFVIGAVMALLSGWLLYKLTSFDETTAALTGLDIGFFIIAALSFYHFERTFPRADNRVHYQFLSYFGKYKSLFISGCCIYSGIYLHNFIYWLGPDGTVIAERFRIMPFYDMPVFYAFLSVVPTLVTFVVSVETSFYEKFRLYYSSILKDGTIENIGAAKKGMQKTLVREISFMMEIQLVFTVIAVAVGIKLLPLLGSTMEQLDLFIILCLAYLLFIVAFVLVHILMYFDDRKGVLMIGLLFIVSNVGFSYWMMKLDYDGLGMFIASFLALTAALFRVLHVLRNIDYFTFCSQPINPIRNMRSRKRRLAPGVQVMALVLMLLVLSGCSVLSIDESEQEMPSRLYKQSPADLAPHALFEDKRLYERDEDGSIKTLYVTILPNKTGSDNVRDWYELNRLPDSGDNGHLEAIVQEGAADGQGPAPGMFGYTADHANASIMLRGNSAWYAPQKSYRIKLYKEAGLWQEQSTLNLNKHSGDLSRVRNKLSFDLFETIPNFSSLRTQYVHLYVKDLTAGDSRQEFVDYGLFTHIEQANKQFLKSHLLDPNGFLYKAQAFEFYRYRETLRSQDDPDYDKAAFETILEIKGREDHAKLIRMLDDLNDYSLRIEEVMEKHFDLDNFLTWMAVNLLTDNMDSRASNFFLYSPLNSEKWYFLPWDYDGGWERSRRDESGFPMQSGLSNYWGSVLQNRYFRTEEHAELLHNKMVELSAIINGETVKELLDKYRPIVEPFLYREPDIRYLPGINSDFEDELQVLIETPERGMQRFLEDLQKPRPFFMDDVHMEAGKLQFAWDISFDLQGDDLLYDVTIASNPQLTQVVASHTGLKDNWLELEVLPGGVYFWKATARDSNGHEQTSFDHYQDNEGFYYSGVRIFEVD